jgi:hypothetical protein
VKSWRLALSVLALVAVSAVPAGAAVRAGGGTFDDPTGDSGAAPDIQHVLLGSHATAVTLGVTLPNRQRLEGQDALLVLMETDGNEATGQPPNGIDYAIQWDTDPAVPYALFRWDGAQFVDVRSRSLRAYFYKDFRISMSRADLGNPSALAFWIESYVGDRLGDEAPDGRIIGYPLSTDPLRLRVAGLTAPKRVKPGKRFALAMKVQRDDLAELSSDGEVTCSAKVGSRSVRVVPAFPADAALCSGVAPRTAKGKTIKVTLSLILDGVTAKRTVSILVR